VIGVVDGEFKKQRREKKVARREVFRRKVFDWFVSRGKRGATDDECQIDMNLSHQSQTVRRWELMKAGLVRDSGRKLPTQTGCPAIVWVATGKPYEDVDWASLDKTIRPVAVLRAQVKTLIAQRDLARAEVAKLRARLEKMS
jgi:hypothetical protein